MTEEKDIFCIFKINLAQTIGLKDPNKLIK